MVDKNHPDIFWRLVRPKKKDVGSIHADIWFWDINNWKVPDNKDCLKIWMLLSKNIDKGLGVIDKSHLKDDWVYSNTFKDGLNKPEFDNDKNQYTTNDLNTPFGSVILFDYRLLHYGIYNTTNYSRISLEFTILFNKNEIFSNWRSWGFCSSHFINRILKEKSTTKVLSVGRNKERSDAFTLGVGNGDGRYSYKQIHMTFESDFLIEAVEHLKPNYIIKFCCACIC